MYINNSFCRQKPPHAESLSLWNVYLSGWTFIYHCFFHDITTPNEFTKKKQINVTQSFFFFSIKWIYFFICLWEGVFGLGPTLMLIFLSHSIQLCLNPFFLFSFINTAVSHSWFAFALLLKSPLITPQKVFKLILRTDCLQLHRQPCAQTPGMDLKQTTSCRLNWGDCSLNFHLTVVAPKGEWISY